MQLDEKHKICSFSNTQGSFKNHRVGNCACFKRILTVLLYLFLKIRIMVETYTICTFKEFKIHITLKVVMSLRNHSIT